MLVTHSETIENYHYSSHPLCSGPESATRGVLYIQFAGGKIYAYMDVPIDVYFQMERAKSLGKFVNKEIKTKFDFRKV